ncbi:MAG: EamA family transporter [Limnobacter sp.]|uniref:EamA family transporter n=1 Tax=Limnobacter sp. TaxID=2003368 RepID=UPI0032EBF182
MTQAAAFIAMSVCMHVVWNLMARQQPKARYVLWWVLIGHLVLLAPWGLYSLFQHTLFTPEFMALAATSATANALYFLGLKKAYDHAPVALVYPLVRSSPLLIALWGLWLFDQHLSFAAWLGIGISVLGLALLADTGRGSTNKAALPWAFLAMLCTSVYSLSDKAATVHIESLSGLLGFVSFGYFAAWLVLTAEMKISSGRWVPVERPPVWMIAVGGLCVGLAYVLVIAAMRSMPAAVVVAFTNAGIVLATLASIFLFKENAHWKMRLVAASTIVGGLLVLRF